MNHTASHHVAMTSNDYAVLGRVGLGPEPKQREFDTRRNRGDGRINRLARGSRQLAPTDAGFGRPDRQQQRDARSAVRSERHEAPDSGSQLNAAVEAKSLTRTATPPEPRIDPTVVQIMTVAASATEKSRGTTAFPFSCADAFSGASALGPGLFQASKKLTR